MLCSGVLMKPRLMAQRALTNGAWCALVCQQVVPLFVLSTMSVLFGLLYCHEFFYSTFSSDDSAAISELGQICVHANGFCFLFGFGLELSCRL